MIHPHFLMHLHQLHLAFLAGGDVRDILAGVVLQPLAAYLHTRRRSSDDQVVGTAASDAILEYLDCPANAKATSGQQVWAHLCRAAWCNASNEDAKERRRGRVEASFGLAEEVRKQEQAQRIVELLHPHGDHSSNVNEADCTLDVPKSNPALRLTSQDQRIWQMMTDGIRRTREYTAVLGITHLPTSEQQQVVKRTKERVRQQVKRSQG